MPGTFIFAIIAAVIGGILAVAWRIAARAAAADSTGRNRYEDEQLIPPLAFAITSAAFGALTVLMVLVSSWNPVGTREIGIVTSFGQLAGHLGPGPNFTAPWDSVTPIDDSYQLTDETFTVRIAGGQTAQATVQVRWNALPSAADDIFQNYKTTAGVQNGLLEPEMNVATNSVLDGYDPLTPLTTGAAAGTPGNPSTAQLGEQIEAALVARVGGDVHVATFNLRPLVYDPTVQARINSVTNQVAKTDVARQSEQTALAQAAANKDIAASVATNPLVLVQQCMNAISDGQLSPPAGFSCWPGQGSGVVIPSASGK